MLELPILLEALRTLSQFLWIERGTCISGIGDIGYLLIETIYMRFDNVHDFYTHQLKQQEPTSQRVGQSSDRSG
jgi:hypothetical protein